jgi:hypothetical protein
MTLAGLGYVGGTTGSNPKRGSSLGVDLPGANAWSVRDWFLDHPDAATFAPDFVSARTNGVAACREENGHDVVYFKVGAGHLMRIEMVDQDYRNDIIYRVGQAWTSDSTANGGALDTVENVFVALRNSTNPIEGWDLDAAGFSNKNFVVPAAGLTGSAAAEFVAHLAAEGAVFSMTYDQRRERFVVWGRGGRVYSIRTPRGSDLTVGWEVTKLSADTLPQRPLTSAEFTGTNADTGASGKFKRSESLDVYVAVQGAYDGNVWMFKPAGWIDPRN